LTIGMMTIREAWSDESCQSRWIEWLSNLLDPLHRNIKLMTEFELLVLSEYLVRTWLVGIDKSKLNESAIISKLSLIEE